MAQASLDQLSSLELNNCKLKDMGVQSLASAQFPKLNDLSLSMGFGYDLGDNGITNNGLATVKGKIRTLECLNLGGNKLND